MKTYHMVVTETRSVRVEVEADSYEEAREKAIDMDLNNEINMDEYCDDIDTDAEEDETICYDYDEEDDEEEDEN